MEKAWGLSPRPPNCRARRIKPFPSWAEEKNLAWPTHCEHLGERRDECLQQHNAISNVSERHHGTWGPAYSASAPWPPTFHLGGTRKHETRWQRRGPTLNYGGADDRGTGLGNEISPVTSVHPVSSFIRPCSSIMTRFRKASVSRISWVATRTVVPRALADSNSRIMSWDKASSRLPVGSSAKST